MVKNPPANTGDTRDVGSIPGSDPWVKKSPWRRKEMATHSSILAWEIPWTEEPDGLCSSYSRRRVRCDLLTKQQQYQKHIICVCVDTSGWIDRCSITWYLDNNDNVLGLYNDNVKFAPFFLLYHMETRTSFLANQ